MNKILSKQISSLTIPEKLELIADVWDSIIIDDTQVPLTKYQKQELGRRLASYDNIKNTGLSWEEVKQRIMENNV
ncbi:addiction module protein [Crocosphaera sp.]|uniref:addiction module protein n=1 Tax=Crocosphaera sp. TaxID=2729996 RepID=UPI00261371C6|nr:addiction module protein [Crocosphaera sp.]MDJ0580097.1 addiction module protein [Crocosphaera sp.]